jgi:hypothetical protein
VSGGAGIQGNVNVGGNAIILSDIGVSGDANVDGGMNVVGNADIRECYADNHVEFGSAG